MIWTLSDIFKFAQDGGARLAVNESKVSNTEDIYKEAVQYFWCLSHA